MFEGGAVATILANNLLYRGGLIASRTLTPTRGGLVDQFGSKIMDNRLTIKNYTAMKEYNGIPLYGYYEVDGEGVTPEAEMTLVEKGVFKKMLNGRTPTLQALETTGSARLYPITTKSYRYDGNRDHSRAGRERGLLTRR